MGEDVDAGPSVPELVEYCQTQAGLLSGQVATLDDEISELLAEIDDQLSALREQIDEVSDGGPGVSPIDADDETDVDAIAAAESDLESTQALVEAKQARMSAYQTLADAYTDLAGELQAEVEDGQVAAERIVQFEAEHDVPAYFPDRQTLLEAATGSDG